MAALNGSRNIVSTQNLYHIMTLVDQITLTWNLIFVTNKVPGATILRRKMGIKNVEERKEMAGNTQVFLHK